MAAVHIALPFVLAAFWLALLGTLTIWIWHGVEPRVFPSPDEAVNRSAALLVRDTGSAKMRLPVDDVEDLRHMRQWASDGRSARPVYPPMTYVLHAGVMSIPRVGDYLVPLLPAAGMGAFCAGVCLLGDKRRWLALSAPGAAFAATYWVLRPWTNMSLLAGTVGIAVLFWALWRRRHHARYLAIALAALALAASVRPDMTHVLLLGGLCFTLAEARPGEWKLVVPGFVLAGVAFLALTLPLNFVITGDPMNFGHEKMRAQQGGNWLPEPFGQLYFLLLPKGVPGAGEIGKQLWKYWFDMGPMALLTAGMLLSTGLLLLSAKPRARALYALGFLLIVLFVISRIDLEVYGASESEGRLAHSLPRYWAAAYLLASVPLCLVAMNAHRRAAWGPAAALLAVLVFWGGQRVWSGEQLESASDLRDYVSIEEQEMERVTRALPENAVIYSQGRDKLLWSYCDIAIVPKPEFFNSDLIASSMARAIRSGEQVFVYALADNDLREVNEALLDCGLMARASGVDQLYRVSGAYRSVPELLWHSGCVSPGVPDPLAIEDVAEDQVASFLGARPDILDAYAASGWNVSVYNNRAILRDWWEVTTEHVAAPHETESP